MAFLFWLGIRGARSAVVRPNAFLRRKSAAFSACNAENIRKCNRHGGGAAAGVSRLSFHFPFSKISRISSVMRPDPDLTQTGAKRGGFFEIYLTKQHNYTIFQVLSRTVYVYRDYRLEVEFRVSFDDFRRLCVGCEPNGGRIATVESV